MFGHSIFMDRGVVYSTFKEACVGHEEARVGHGEVRVVVHSKLRLEVWSIPPLGRFVLVIGRLEVWSITP